MKIRWSDDAAQEMKNRLDAATQALQDADALGRRAATLLEQTNADGGNSALRKMQQRLSEWQHKLEKLQTHTATFRTGLVRAGQLMDEAEQSAIRRTRQLLAGHGAEIDSGRYGAFAWSHSDVFILPQTRSAVAPIPDWLSAQADRFDRDSFTPTSEGGNKDDV